MLRASLLAVVSILVTACSPVVPIPAGSDVSSLVLSRSTPEANFESLTFNHRSYDAPYFSFDIPAGTTSIGLRYRVDAIDRCDSGAGSCALTRTSVSCSGSFTAVPNVGYRILVDPRNGQLKATIQRREGSAMYVGQDEKVISSLACEIVNREERSSHVTS